MTQNQESHNQPITMEIISQSRIGVEHNIFSPQIIPNTFCGIPNRKEVCICKVYKLINTFSLLKHVAKYQTIFATYNKYTFNVQKWTLKV